MKKVILCITLLCIKQQLFGQAVENVGINTFSPDRSAILDVQATNKGVLLPSIFIQSTTDAGTISNPAPTLLFFNTNPNLLERTGFYYNSGTSTNPFWKNVEQDLQLPFNQTVASSAALFSIENTSLSQNSAAIGGFISNGQGVAGISSSGTALTGISSGAGTGLFASSLTGIALQVEGKVKISGGTTMPGAGKVLTADNLGNATWTTQVNEFDNIFNGFHASGVLGGGNQNMSENSYVKIAFASQKYDIGTNYNDANMAPHSSFIAPKNGIYHFDVMIRWSKPDPESTFGPTIKLVRIRNGVTTELSENRSQSTRESFTSHIAMDSQLQTGDIVNVIARAYGPQVALSVDERDANFTGHLAIEQ